MEQRKKFDPFERILLKNKKEGFWFCDIFCHEKGEYFFSIGSRPYLKDDFYILPFEGNAHLVGTSDMPEEEVELKEGDIIVTFDNIRDIDMPFEVSINQFKHLNESSIHVCIKDDETEFIAYSNFCIPFSQFNPNDMEETRKHILCVKNGKIVKARV